MNTTGDDLPWPGGYERRGPSSPLRVLIGLDDLEGSAHLLAYATVLDKAGNAIARVLHVVEHVTAMAGPVIETPEEALELVDEAVFSLRMAGVGASGTVRHGRVNRIATGLLDEAASWQADAIVLSGRRRRGWRAISGRGVREQVLRRSPIPTTLVAPPAPTRSIGTIPRTRVERSPGS
jgi:nucleotide-binding universal stress UspA family protein